jgi:serine/threonine protein kinase
MEDLTGKQFGHYQIVAPLGEGGMAAVYKAYQPSMERSVAVKVLPRHMSASEEFVNRFRREAKLLAQLQHPHILPVFDYGEADGYPYIVMPFVNSGTLANLLQNRQLSLPEVRRVMTQLGDALGYAHARGMIHRDIKPSNVLIDERGNCLLTDFGLARMAESSTKITSSGAVMGTPAYMSPEQGAGSNIDHRSDIYSLGIILYEMVTGRVPYTAETPVAVVFKHIQDPLPSARKLNPNLPESIELVLLKALAKNPDDRYQNAEDFVRAIQKAVPDTDTPDQSILQVSPASTQNLQSAPSQNIVARPETEATISKSGPTGRFPIWIFVAFGIMALAAIAIFIGSNMLAAQIPPSPSVTNIPTKVSAPIIDSPVPSVTSTPPTEPSSSAVNFQDDFAGQLAEGWTWLEEDPTKWSLSAVAGSLQIVASDASFDGPYLPLNILLRDAPSGDFEISTALHFTPTSDYQAAGLVVFQGQGNALQLSRAFCDTVNACVGDGVYFDNFENGSITGSNYHTAFHGSVIYLRLQREGNTYTGYYSEDGQNWIMTGKHVRDFSQVQVGLVAAQASTEIPALFDYFTMNVLQQK